MTQEEHELLLGGVLVVPGLNRRLFSVPQWTSSSGTISFNPDNCVLSIIDQDNPDYIRLQVTLKAPFTLTPSEDPHLGSSATVTDESTTTTKKKSKSPVPANLLHKRLGHRSLPALTSASEADVWEDSNLPLIMMNIAGDAKLHSPRRIREELPLWTVIPLSPQDLILCWTYKQMQVEKESPR